MAGKSGSGRRHARTDEPSARPSGVPQRIPIDKLRFDRANPRIVERLGEMPTQAQIEQLLLGGEMKARELVPSFIENGFIPYEPLVVRPESGNNYIVVEGNRRLAAIRSMKESDDEEEIEAFQKHELDRVPCLIFRGDERQLLAYLGLRHLSKTKDWSTSAKGAFVERVLKAGHDLKAAGRLTNTTTSALRLTLLTRRLFDKAGELGLELPAAGADGETIFWHLGDAIRRTRTKSYLKLEEATNPLETPTYDETRFENLVGWLYGNIKTKQQRVIDSIRDIKALDECLGSERAIKALENGASLAEAHEELEAAGATVSAHLERAKKSVQRAMSGLSDVDKKGLDQVEGASNQLMETHEQFQAALEHRRSVLKTKK